MKDFQMSCRIGNFCPREKRNIIFLLGQRRSTSLAIVLLYSCMGTMKMKKTMLVTCQLPLHWHYLVNLMFSTICRILAGTSSQNCVGSLHYAKCLERKWARQNRTERRSTSSHRYPDPHLFRWFLRELWGMGFRIGQWPMSLIPGVEGGILFYVTYSPSILPLLLGSFPTPWIRWWGHESSSLLGADAQKVFFRSFWDVKGQFVIAARSLANHQLC